jgi:hypothetical protein
MTTTYSTARLAAVTDSRRSVVPPAAAGKLFLIIEDVGRILGEESGQGTPMTNKTIMNYVFESLPDKASGEEGRYAGCPIPMPDRSLHTWMWWPAEGETIKGLERRIRNWYHEAKAYRAVAGAAKRKATIAAQKAETESTAAKKTAKKAAAKKAPKIG